MLLHVPFSRARALLSAAVMLCAVLGSMATVFASAASELVVADRRAGVALYGFDPLSYFVEGTAELGDPAHELLFAGFAWHFRSEANRAAFRAQPDVYVPRFGGYDPIALMRGAPVAGHPAIFAIHEGRLFLFQEPEHRAEFLATPGTVAEAARANWPRIRRTLVH